MIVQALPTMSCTVQAHPRGGYTPTLHLRGHATPTPSLDQPTFGTLADAIGFARTQYRVRAVAVGAPVYGDAA